MISVNFQKLSISQPFKNFPNYYGTQICITVFTRPLHLSPPSAWWNQSLPPHHISLRSMFMCTHIHEEGRLLGCKNPVRTSQETHYFSAAESSHLMLCKICGFHGFDYEECRLLGYKIQVRTSQETHYVSAIETSRLILCKVWGFHGGDYEECRLLGWYAFWLL
jgi:hypothetical protein